MIASPGNERALIASLLQEPRRIYGVASQVNRDFFQVDANKILFDIIKHSVLENDIKVFDKMILEAQAESMNIRNFTKLVSGDYIDALHKSKVHKEGIPTIVSTLRKAYSLRVLRDHHRNAASKIETGKINTEGSAQELISRIQSDMMDVTQSLFGSDEVKKLGEGVGDYLKQTVEMGSRASVIPTCMEKWNDTLGGGIRKGGVTIIAARPKVGKSTLSDHILNNFTTEQGIPGFLLDTEMDSTFHKNLMISQISGVPRDEIEKGMWANHPDTEKKVKNAADKIEKAPLYYKSIAGISIEEVIVLIREFIHRFVGLDEKGLAKDCVIIYDFLHLDNIKRISRNVQEYQVLGHFLSMLRKIAVQYKVPIVLVIQLNRDGIDSDYGVASGTDRVEWFCWSMTILRKKTPEEIARDDRANGNVKAKTVYSRTGPGHDVDNYLNLNIDYTTGKIEEGISYRELAKGRKNEQRDGEKDSEEKGSKKRGRRKNS